MSVVTKYYEGQGRVMMGAVGADIAKTGFIEVGDCPSLAVSFDTETEEVKESITGQRLLVKQIAKDKKATIKMKAANFSKENLALALYGAVTEDVAGTIAEGSPETFTAADLVDGTVYPLAHHGVTSVVVKDSAGTPATLTLTTHYRINAEQGSIELVNKSTFTGPLKVSYAYRASSRVGMFTATTPEKMLRFEGLNIAETGEAVIIELYKIQFKPCANLDLINTEVFIPELEGAAMADTTRAIDATYGRFGRITKVSAAA